MRYDVKVNGTVVSLLHDDLVVFVADVRWGLGYHTIREQEALALFHTQVAKLAREYITDMESRENGPR